MRYPIKEIFNIAELNKPLPSTTIQEQIADGVNVFSLGTGTSISPEAFHIYKMIFVKQGKIRFTIKDDKGFPVSQELEKNDGVVTERNKVIMIDAEEDSVYLEIMLGRTVNHMIKEVGEVFSISKIDDYIENNYTITTIISSGFVDVKLICMDNTEIDKTIDTTTMIFGYEGTCELEADGEKFIIEPDTSMRFLPGTHLNVKSYNSKAKVGVTNFFI